MKKIAILMVMIFAWIGISSADSGKDAPRPNIVFTNTMYDFGTIQENQGMVTCEFKFTNKGDAPLVITSATAACGCTKPSFDEAPIAPGKSSKITVSFNPKGRPGEFSKNITIRTNDPAHKKVVLKISGVVVPKS